MAALDELIAELERSYTETRDRMSDPAVYNDHREAAEVGRRLKQLEGPYNLAQAGSPPDELHTSAAVTFQPGEGITRIALTARGTVPGLDEEAFRQAAQAAKEGCPVSQALAGVKEITLEASLA